MTDSCVSGCESLSFPRKRDCAKAGASLDSRQNRGLFTLAELADEWAYLE